MLDIPHHPNMYAQHMIWLLQNIMSGFSMLVTTFLVRLFFKHIFGAPCMFDVVVWICKLSHENSTPDVARWSLLKPKLDSRKIHCAPLYVGISEKQFSPMPLAFQPWDCRNRQGVYLGKLFCLLYRFDQNM